MFKLVVSVEPDVWLSGIQHWVQDIDDAISDALSDRQAEMEYWMRENAPWEDVTGQARASLSTDTQNNVGEWVLLFGYSRRVFEDYGHFLEYDHAGRFSILTPTMDYFFPLILDDLNEILSD